MDILQQQCHLTALGFYKLRRQDGTPAIDGIGGPATTEAIAGFQLAYGLVADGLWGPLTEARLRKVIGERLEPVNPPVNPPLPAGDKYPYLKDWQKLIRCQCGGRYCKGLPESGYSHKTLELANEVGRQLGTRLVCSSGYRCPQHNAETPGASPTSCHMRAIAFDCCAENGTSPQKLYEVADRVVGDQGGVGKYSWGIHLDSRGYRARW